VKRVRRGNAVVRWMVILRCGGEMPMQRSRAKQRRIKVGPYSSPNTLTELDGRVRVARSVRAFAKELTEHVGGEPTAAQKVLIREASIKNAKLAMLADKVLNDSDVDVDLATRCYLAWSNALRRDLEALGLKAPEQQAPHTLASILRPRQGRPPKVVRIAAS
jgi:hypothetical protein